MFTLQSTLRIKQIPSLTIILSIVLAVVLLAGIETLARLSIVRDRLLAPSVGSAHTMLESQLYTLEEFEVVNGSVDCFFVGSSLVVHGIDPDTFETAYYEQTGQRMNCFNFGVYGLDAVNAALVIEMLIKSYHPKIIFYGLSAHALGQTHPAFLPLLDFKDNAWFQYQSGQFSPQGWLIDHSRAYRYLLRYQSWLHGLVTVGKNILQKDGFQGKHYLRYGAIDQPPNDLEADLWAWVAGWHIVPDQVDALQRIAELIHRYDTRIFVYEMPVHPSYFAYFHGGMSDHAAFVETVRDIMQRDDLPFWATTPLDLVSFRGWSERHHMMESGAFLFSYWLGSEYGQAVQDGLWGSAPPADILINPPLESVALPPIETLYESSVGLSGQHLEHYLNYIEVTDFLPEGARVFNPRTDPDDLEFLTINTGVYGQDYLPLEGPDTEYFYNLLLTLEHVVYEADLDAGQQREISAWRQDKQPEHLLEAGLDYIAYTDAWSGWLSPEEAVILTDPAYYERVGEWFNNTSAETYTLYRVMKP